MPSKFMSSDEPPALTNGSGMPLVGIRPRTTLMLTNACTAIIVVNPSARNAPNRSGACRTTRRPRHVMTQKQPSDQRRAHEAELLGDHRIDEIGVRLGQEEQLLHAVHQPFAPHAARADSDERLNDLEAAAERIAPRIEKGQQAAAPIAGARR